MNKSTQNTFTNTINKKLNLCTCIVKNKKNTEKIPFYTFHNIIKTQLVIDGLIYQKAPRNSCHNIPKMQLVIVATISSSHNNIAGTCGVCRWWGSFCSSVSIYCFKIYIMYYIYYVLNKIYCDT